MRKSWLTKISPRLPRKFSPKEDINFLITNRLPRRWATLFMGRFSRIEVRWVRALSIGMWRTFSRELDLSDAKKSKFSSLHDCFIRELQDGSRPIDPNPSTITSPCDAIIGTHGRIDGDTVIQAKGFPYRLTDLFHDDELVERHRGGTFITMRLKASMYHRFHAPTDCRVRGVTYVSGDTWNVNPIALKRVEQLFCKNERAVIDLDLGDPNRALTLVPVAAILVASIKLHFLDDVLSLEYRGPNRIPCDATFRKGDEMGYFQHGSTILLFANGDFELCPELREGSRVRVGEPLLRTES